MNDLQDVLAEALFLRWLLVWKDKPATRNMALTKDQIARRGYMLDVVLSFKEMQEDETLIVEN